MNNCRDNFEETINYMSTNIETIYMKHFYDTSYKLDSVASDVADDMTNENS